MTQATECTAESLPKARKYGIGTRTPASSSGLKQISTIRPPLLEKSENSAETHSTRDVARRKSHSVRTTKASAAAKTDHVPGLPRGPNFETGTQSSSSSGYGASDPTASPSDHVQKNCKASTTNFWRYSAPEKRPNKVGDLDFSQALTKSATLGTGRQTASIREIGSEELRRLGDCQFRALANRDLRLLEAEIERCCQDNAGLHGRVRQEMESVIQRLLRTMKHGGDMDVDEAIEYNDELFHMQKKFEDFGFSLQKAKADLARAKTLCVQTRCSCWWCEGCTGVRKLIRMYLGSLKMGNKYRRRRRMSSPL